MKDGLKAIKVTDIWSGEERYFLKISNMCKSIGWDTQQFRNHKSRQKDKEKFTYKECKLETILIE